MWNVELIRGYWRVTKNGEPVGPYKFDNRWEALKHMSIIAPEKDVEEVERMLYESFTIKDLLKEAIAEHEKNGDSEKCKSIVQQALYKAAQQVAKPSAKLYNPGGNHD